MVEALLANPRVDVMAIDDEGNVPLHLAAMNDQMWAMPLLIADCIPCIWNNEGKIAQDLAKDREHSELVQKLSGYELKENQLLPKVFLLGNGKSDLMRFLAPWRYQSSLPQDHTSPKMEKWSKIFK